MLIEFSRIAIMVSEYSLSKERGKIMAITFSMQAFGFFMGDIVAVVVLAIFKKPIYDNIDNLDYVWRIIIGIGAIPACAMIYFRFTIHNILRLNVSKDFGKKSKASPGEFREYFAKWKNFKLLLATTVCWFVFNVSFFGINLNTGIMIEAMGFSGNLQDDLWYSLFRSSIGILIITLLGLIPGYW